MAQEIRGRVGKVRLPKSVRAFDCRCADDEPTPQASYGERLFGGEAAAYLLGLRYGRGLNEQFDVFGRSISFSFDTRDPRCEAELERVLTAVRGFLAEAWCEYRRAKRHPGDPQEGGEVVYKPVGLYIANYAVGILHDRRMRAVVPFEPEP